MGSPPPPAKPLHSRAAATSTTMAEGTFGKKRFRRYMPAMHRADTTAQAHEAPGRHETMAATFGHNGTGGVGRRAQKQQDLADDHRDRDAEYEPVHDRQRHAADESPRPAQPSSRRNSAVKREQGAWRRRWRPGRRCRRQRHRAVMAAAARIHAEPPARASEVARRRAAPRWRPTGRRWPATHHFRVAPGDRNGKRGDDQTRDGVLRQIGRSIPAMASTIIVLLTFYLLVSRFPLSSRASSGRRP